MGTFGNKWFGDNEPEHELSTSEERSKLGAKVIRDFNNEQLPKIIAALESQENRMQSVGYYVEAKRFREAIQILKLA
jgi:hypothetical protein